MSIQTRTSRSAARAFTLVDVMVSLSVVAILISLMIPGLATARETARRVVCASNARQLGIGVVLWADAHDGRVPPSVFNSTRNYSPSVGGMANSITISRREMSMTRLPTAGDFPVYEEWDGLGLLFADDVLRSPRVFYCPSHGEPHPFERFADQWNGAAGSILANYHYRGEGQNGSTRLAFLEPARAALIADSLRSPDELNHDGGVNLLRADLSASWVSDPDNRLGVAISEALSQSGEDEFGDVWDLLDDLDNGPDEAGDREPSGSAD